jgi:hypothetical protein
LEAGFQDGIGGKRHLPRDSMIKFAMPTRKAAWKLDFETALKEKGLCPGIR